MISQTAFSERVWELLEPVFTEVRGCISRHVDELQSMASRYHTSAILLFGWLSLTGQQDFNSGEPIELCVDFHHKDGTISCDATIMQQSGHLFAEQFVARIPADQPDDAIMKAVEESIETIRHFFIENQDLIVHAVVEWTDKTHPPL